MSMTKQQVFSLYLANEGQTYLYDYPNKTLKDKEVFSLTPYFIYQETLKKKGGFDNCTLLLKDVRDMSEEDMDILNDKLKECEQDFETATTDLQEAMALCYSSGQITLWLIQNGYCLDNEWIKAGWVEIEKEMK